MNENLKLANKEFLDFKYGNGIFECPECGEELEQGEECPDCIF